MCSSFITCNHIVYMSIYTFLQINLPPSVVKRFRHCITAYEISNGYCWLVLTGGYRNIYVSPYITGSDVTFIIELGMLINYISWDILVIIISL